MQAASLLKSSPHFSPSSLLPSKTRVFRFSPSTTIKSPKRSQTPLKSLTRVSSSQATTESPISPPPPPPSIGSASDVVKQFYTRINGHDLDSVANLIAENCVYEDLVFSQPFVGRKAILDFFKKFTDSISTDLKFVIDDISSEDSSAVGVTWHLEWRGRPFPFSKGCSFYRLEVVNGQRQIVYGRDSVEPAIKPGEMALIAIGGVTRLLQSFPQLADRL
ncbi:hypothetical protein MRB53_014890 [Persea americana]|uniref:Uncharacterized protein n=1 Tax=Persea americana TaxID=3435 RepID=A0ACC2KCM6_PERAE|nr:hypothetical protein MRB53_014890 [Persea americana]